MPFQPRVPSAKRTAELDQMMVQLTLSDLTGHSLSPGAIVTAASQLNVAAAASVICKLGIVLSLGEPADPVFQRKLVERWLPPTIRKRALECLTRDRRVVVFSEIQLLGALYMILRHGARTGGLDPSNLPHGTAAFLAVLFGSSEHREDAFPALPADTEGQRVWFNEFAVRSLHFNHQEHWLRLFGRYYRMLVELPAEPRLQTHPNYLDVPRLYDKYVGASLIRVLGFALSIITHYHAELREDPPPDAPYALDINAWFRPTSVPNTPKLQELFVADVGEFPLDASPEAVSSVYGIMAFRQKPLLRLGDLVMPLSLRFLAERATIGAYWDLADHLPDALQNRFFVFFGVLLEEYVREVFQRIDAGRPAGMSKRVFGEEEISYRVGRNTLHGSDITVVYAHDRVLLVEVTAARLRMVETASTGKLDAFLSDAMKVLKKVKQLDRVIASLRLGAWSVGGLRSDAFVQPVIVVPESFPQTPLLWDEFDRVIKDAGWLMQPNVGRPVILDCGDVEWLEASGVNMFEVLQRKAADETLRRLPLANVAEECGLPLQVNASPFAQAMHHRLAAAVGDDLFRSK